MVVGLHLCDALRLCGLGGVVRRVLALYLVGARPCGVGLHLGNLRRVFQLSPAVAAVIAISIRPAERADGDQSNHGPCRKFTAAKQFREDGDHCGNPDTQISASPAR